jgi:hypothetical protein
MKKTILFSLTLLMIGTGVSRANTPDGVTPSRETVCDSQSGAAYGLCNAYCEAMDCDSPAPQASPTACSRVRNNYTRITGQALFPCEVTCPCTQSLPLFGSIVSGATPIEQCVSDFSNVTSVVTESGIIAIVNRVASPPYCSINNETFVQITAAEAQVCGFLLREGGAGAPGVWHAPA